MNGHTWARKTIVCAVVAMLAVTACMVVLPCEMSYAMAPAGWKPQVSNTTNALRRVEVIPGSAGSVWSAGDAGTVRKTSDYGANWNTQNPGLAQAMQGLTSINTNTAWLCASNGNIRKTTNGGTSWTSQYTAGNGLYGLSAVNANTAYACGANGTILKTTNGGTGWNTPLLFFATNTFYDVQAIDANNVWVVGSAGGVYRTTNGGGLFGWTSVGPGGTTVYYGVAAVNANIAWIAGSGGVIRKTTNGGGAWTVQASGTTQDLKKIIALDANTAWAVGNAGVILKTTNGGTTWTAQRSGVTTNLCDISALNTNTAWAVGEGGLILYTDSGGWIPLPHIDTVIPGAGVVGSEVTITGTSFFDPRSTSSVSFGTAPVTSYTSWSETQIKCLVPAGVYGTVPVTVTTDGGTSNTFDFSATPQLLDLAPPAGSIGTEVTLTGTAFGLARGTAYVSFGTVQATNYGSWSDTQIKCLAPAGISGTVQVTVTTAGGTTTSLPFNVTPHIDPIHPDEGFINTEVTITGTGFGATRGTSSVTFGTTPVVTYNDWSDTEIKVLEPVTTPGAVPITVTTSGGTSNTRTFTVEPYLLTSLETWDRDGEPGGGNIDFGSINSGTETDNVSPAAVLSVTATVPYTSTVAAVSNFEDGAGHLMPLASFFWSSHGGGSWTSFASAAPCASGSPNWPSPAQYEYDYRISPPSNQAMGTYQVTIRYTTYQP